MAISQGSFSTGPAGLKLKAWVKFNSVTGAIDAQFNVASVVRPGPGQYTVTFTVPLATTRYFLSTAGAAVHNIGPGLDTITIQNSTALTTACSIQLQVQTGTVGDRTGAYVEFWE